MKEIKMKQIQKLCSILLFVSLCFSILSGTCLQTDAPNLISVSAATKTPLQRYGRLKVSGPHLVDSKGKTVQLKGVSTHGLAWYPQYVNKKAFQTLRDEWGVEVIRLAMYTAEYNGYCTGSAQNQSDLKKLIKKAVKYCDELGLYVIIDWHTLSDADPNIYKKQAVSFFRAMSKKYAGHKNVIYEICNEPNGGTSWEQIRSYSNKIIKTIRKADNNAIIITGTPTWSQDVDIAAASPLKGRNIMYAFHYYASTHTETYRTRLQAAIDAGLPIFVSEYGISEASGNGSVNQSEADQWMKLLDKNKISCVAWNLSNKDEACALINTGCTKTYGWKRSELSESGKWVYDMLRR